ncbi:hypothetical protein V502_02020 [Pseudogymnoascus sp. VKM F-4520 (FW-2644)]|nr:hypothetical protein V502_02020 [Pseudogymnoascus sp. VKM F-4520 (FW-2644)]
MIATPLPPWATPSSGGARGPTSTGEMVDGGYLPRRYRRRAQEGLDRGAVERAAADRWRDLLQDPKISAKAGSVFGIALVGSSVGPWD